VNQGDIYLVDLDPTEGREQRGYRPVVVVSSTDFNRATNLPVVLPVTSTGAFARRIGFAVLLTGIATTGVVRCDQPRVVDLQARGARRVGALPAPVLAEVLARVRPIFGRS
jgi:mRNA interferase ChpB